MIRVVNTGSRAFFSGGMYFPAGEPQQLPEDMESRIKSLIKKGVNLKLLPNDQPEPPQTPPPEPEPSPEPEVVEASTEKEEPPEVPAVKTTTRRRKKRKVAPAETDDGS